MRERGEGWVILQLLLLLIILSIPEIGGEIGLPWTFRALGGLIIIAAGVIILLGMVALGQSYTFSKASPWRHLITHGIYGTVRHPLYMAVIFGTLGWGLLTANLLVMGMIIIVFLFVDLKSRREEEWLAEAYPEYASYRHRVKKLIPWVY